MSSEPQEGQKTAIILLGVATVFTFVVLPWMSAQDAMRQRAEDAKPKPMAPCESVLDECYVNNGHGDAAWLIKREDEKFGTRKHEESLNQARGVIAADALCEHKQKQGYDCE